jgi:WD40 repeat protein
MFAVINRRNGADIVLREVPGGKEIQTISRRTLRDLTFHPDGRLLEWMSDGAHDALTGKEVLPIRSRHPQGFAGVSFSRDGKRLATAEIMTTPGVGEVRVWDVATAKELFSLQGHVEGVTCIDFSPDGKLLATGSQDKNVKVWDAATGKELGTYRGHRMRLLHLRFTPDGKRLVSVSVDGELKNWDPMTGQ